MTDLMGKHLNDALRRDGNILDLGAYDTNKSLFLSIQAAKHNRNLIIFGTFDGTEPPTEHDYNQHRYMEYPKGKKIISLDVLKPKIERASAKYTNISYIKGDSNTLAQLNIIDEKFCFVHLNLLQYIPTKKALDLIWDKIEYGGTLYISSYAQNANYMSHKAINEFMAQCNDDILVSKQLLVNGVRENSLIIKCLNPKNKTSNSLPIVPTQKVIIAMVLKTGGIYTHQYVNNLINGVRKNLKIPHEIVCLTDNSAGIKGVDKIIPLINNFPRWWSKIELFRPDIFEDCRVLYIDLDTLILNDISEIAMYDGDFCGLRDFYHLHSLGSGVLAWGGGKYNNIYIDFIKNSKNIIDMYSGGDQVWIYEKLRAFDFFQDIYPKKIISYKKDCVQPNGDVIIPSRASILCFHGNPRIHAIKNDIIQSFWNR